MVLTRLWGVIWLDCRWGSSIFHFKSILSNTNILSDNKTRMSLKMQIKQDWY